MPETALAHPGYTVQLPVFEGPLDLLLHLIERAELDITRVALAKVTDQFLGYLAAMQERHMEEVVGFLVIAARLLQIKSEALLPRPPQREAGEEDPGEDLARQLRLYKAFKKSAEFLQQRVQLGLRSYVRLAPPPRVPPRFDLSSVTLADLTRAAAQVFARSPIQQPLNSLVSAPKVTIREQIRRIADAIRSEGKAAFNRVIRGFQTKMEVVVAFLAMLELVKRRQVVARQFELFGEIELVPTETWNDDADFDLEFGE